MFLTFEKFRMDPYLWTQIQYMLRFPDVCLANRVFVRISLTKKVWIHFSVSILPSFWKGWGPILLEGRQ